MIFKRGFNICLTLNLKKASKRPFSDRLNQWLKDWYIDRLNEGLTINWTDEDDFDSNDVEGTFRRHRTAFIVDDAINIWKGASDNSIYGENLVNLIARAWHDYTHFHENLGYNTIDEIMVGKIQASQLPNDWWFEKALIEADVASQVLYYHKYNKFPEDQREFILTHLKTGKI